MNSYIPLFTLWYIFLLINFYYAKNAYNVQVLLNSLSKCISSTYPTFTYINYIINKSLFLSPSTTGICIIHFIKLYNIFQITYFHRFYSLFYHLHQQNFQFFYGAKRRIVLEFLAKLHFRGEEPTD